VAAIFAILLAASAIAADNEVRWSEGDDPQLYACLEKSGPVDPAMQECWRQLAEREDDRLNHNWKILIHRVGGSKTAAGQALLAEQRAWLAFRDASCLYFAGGTLDILQRQICYTQRITFRADEVAGMVGRSEAFTLDQSIRTDK
jgi:uncharacterized protein YecT (DUF1311 family)